MRILHLFGQMTRNGAQLRTIEVTDSNEFKNYTFDYCSLSGREGELDGLIRERGGEVFYSKIYSLLFPIKLFNLIRRGQYNVVHSHVHYSSGFILIIAWLVGVKGRVAHFRNNHAADSVRFRVVQNLIVSIKKLFIKLTATDILAVNETTMRIAWSKEWQQDSRCKVVYNGIPQFNSDLRTSSLVVREELALSEDKVVVIHMGRYDLEKNHMFVIKVFEKILARNPNAHLLLAGKAEGALHDQVVRYVADNGLTQSISILGLRDDIPDLLSVSELMLFPSLWEGLPGALLESLSAGTSVLASDIPPTKEVNLYVDGLYEMSLLESPETWADQAVKIINEGSGLSDRKTEIRSKFNEAPFSLEGCASTLHLVWNQYV